MGCWGFRLPIHWNFSPSCVPKQPCVLGHVLWGFGGSVSPPVKRCAGPRVVLSVRQDEMSQGAARCPKAGALPSPHPLPLSLLPGLQRVGLDLPPCDSHTQASGPLHLSLPLPGSPSPSVHSFSLISSRLCSRVTSSAALCWPLRLKPQLHAQSLGRVFPPSTNHLLDST